MISHKAGASIITIGDELLIGQVIDSNSAWIGQQLGRIGIPVIRRVAVGDNAEDIHNALDEESKRADIILITGGLGPTADDITKPALCSYFQGQLQVHEPTLEHITELFEKIFKRPLTEVNRRQAEVPDCCTVMANNLGSAPGMMFLKGQSIFISMPGVPHEMQGIMENEVLPFLEKKYSYLPIIHHTLLTAGIGESMLAEKIKDFEAALPAFIKLAYLPNFNLVRLRLSATVTEPAQAAQASALFNKLCVEVKDYLVTDRDETMAEAVVNILKTKQATLCTAESCSGGTIAAQLTAIPGASAVFNGSVVCYSNETKMQLLGVTEDMLEQNGAVSEAVVRQMVKGILNSIPSTFALAVSGIMGPTGGEPGKPVGTVWIAAGTKEKIITEKMHFRFDRTRNIQLTSIHALNILRKFILNI
ncbi:MAG: CinA family nicotinamide mononucleotide deamidase-related protein [Ferruginibacter sp.]